MGNRAVVSFSTAKAAPAVYLHWNGGRASVDGFCAAMRTLGVDTTDPRAALDRFAELAAATLGARVDVLTVYRTTYGRADVNNGDNGAYVLGADWRIKRRMCAPRCEEVDAEKSHAIEVATVAHGALL